MKQSRPRHFSFAWQAAIWIILIAGLAVCGLYLLQHWHRDAAHQAAARTVGERGQWLTMNLALQAAEVSERGTWQDFSELLQSLRQVESDLEFVSVKDGEVVLFEEHGGDEPLGLDPQYRFAGPVTINRKRLNWAGEDVPVVSFLVAMTNPAGRSLNLEMGMHRRAVEREEWTASRAIDSMYRLTLGTIVVCFGICLALVAWMARKEERQEQNRRREEHLAFSGVLANGIVHDFRNPMSSLRLDAQMLEKEAGRTPACRPERMAELAGRMRHTLDRMEKVFQEFLVLARPGQDSQAPVDLCACIRECTEMLQPRFEAAEVGCSLGLPDGSVMILASEGGINRALINILLNATQHAGAGGHVNVELQQTGPRIQVDVCDTGPGIPEADRERVFEMFYTTRPQGTGLGLFLARTAIEKSGGRISVADPAGAGTRMRLVFSEWNKETE